MSWLWAVDDSNNLVQQGDPLLSFKHVKNQLYDEFDYLNHKSNILLERSENVLQSG